MCAIWPTLYLLSSLGWLSPTKIYKLYCNTSWSLIISESRTVQLPKIYQYMKWLKIKNRNIILSIRNEIQKLHIITNVSECFNLQTTLFSTNQVLLNLDSLNYLFVCLLLIKFNNNVVLFIYCTK